MTWNRVRANSPPVPAGQNSDPDYIVDASARYDLTDSALVHASVNNLFGDQPHADLDYREDERPFKIGLTTRF